ncbi:hypothetical protein ACWGCW_00745 [Streptomyces sp. NPDC054933]
MTETETQAGLRERLAEALAASHGTTLDAMAAAVLPVVARYCEQLAAGRETWKVKAAEIEADRDRLARKLAATVRVRDDAIEALDSMQIERDRLAAKVEALEACYGEVAADALKHRGCHMKLGGVLNRAEKAEALAEARRKAEDERDRLAAEVEELRTEVEKRKAYLEKLRAEAGKNYGDAKKLRRWLDEERELSLAHSEETEAAVAKIARVRAIAEVIEANGVQWAADSIRAALDGTGEA